MSFTPRDRKWKFVDLDGEHVVSEAEILRTYFPHWSEQMWLAGKAQEITHDACVEDWVVVNWAQPVDSNSA